MTVSYTYDWYREFLKECQKTGLPFCEFDRHGDEGVRLRHDVDFSPRRARRMAEIEAEEGAMGIYFFLITGSFYNALNPRTLALIREIAGLGHRIGLHFDVAAYFETKPSAANLQQQIESDRRILDSRVSAFTDVIAFHNPPEWVLGESFEGVVHTYEPAFFSKERFRSDSLGRWRQEAPFADGVSGICQVLVHPGLWGETDAEVSSRIRGAQREAVDRIDESMYSGSRLEWEGGTLEW